VKSQRSIRKQGVKKALKGLAAILLAMDEKELLKATASGAFVEVSNG
jgi:hypothetical protein